MPSTTDSLDQIVKAHGLAQQIATEFRALLAVDERMARSVLSQLAQSVGLQGSSNHERPKKTRTSSVFETIAELFIRTGNMPKTKAEIESDTGLSPGSVHTCLYSTAADKFVRLPTAGPKRQVVITLKRPEFERLKAAAEKGGA